jgi:formylglycine-generating enzyme required for sulfatase activity
MSGNVFEWTSMISTNIFGPSGMMRGGNWSSGAQSVRIANRNSITPASKGDGIGFRVAFSSI